MKHSIPVKFIAIILCAACLLAAVGSGLSIVVLAENGLYDKSPEEVYAERMEDQAYYFAENTAQNYACINLGGCPEEMLSHYYYFNEGYYGYVLMDAAGNVLDELPLAETGDRFQYTFTVSGSYMKVLNSYGASTGTTTIQTDSLDIYDAISEDSSLVFGIGCSFGADSMSTGSDEPLGFLEHSEDGCARFVSFEPHIVDLPEVMEPTQMTFMGEDDEVIYSITSDDGVGQIYYDEGGLLCFVAAVPTALQQQAAAYAADGTEAVVMADNVDYFTYFDDAVGHEVTVEYEWDLMPEYTVTVFLRPGATSDVYDYTLAGTLRLYRNNFPWLLGIGLLLFAVTLVYLCCAAGRKPGSDEVRPMALNRLPLDLYLGIDVLAVSGLAVACAEGGTALFRENADVGLGFVVVTGYAMALIIVAYICALAGQMKSKDRYWIRNTICARVIMLIVRFIRWVDRWAHKVWPAFCARTKAAWGWFKRAVVKTYLFIEKAITKFCLFLIRLVKAIGKYGWLFLVKAYKFIAANLTRFFKWLGRHIARFFSLLPLTWQWLLMGFALMFLIFCAVVSGSGGGLLAFLCAGIAIILYGAHCFGVLLESARKMRQGDLEAKVDDKMLLGSFRDFSDELNGLANVTTVAVQKQLKSERMKTELITNVSHDIKTPLTSIINYVDLMKMPHTDEEHELYLEVLDRQSQRLKKLIEDLMEMSKASTGNIAVDLIPLNAAEAVNQALGEFSDKLHSVGLTPVFHQPEQPVTILADGRLIWRVLSNLLSNAYKYALPGTRLYLDLMVLDGKGVITIKNISKEQLNVDAGELMERFVRGDASRNTEGSGLGLNIAKSLVELQQGQMELMVDGDLFKVTLLFPLA